MEYSKKQAQTVWKAEMNFLLKSSGLAKKYFSPIELKVRKHDREVFEYLEDIRGNVVEHVQAGLNILLLSSEVGNGKTSWTVKLMQRYFAEIAIGNGTKVSGKFISVPTMLADLSDYNFRSTNDFRKMIEEIKAADIVVWDELGGGSLNKVNYPLFYSLINERIDSGLSNIYTTNFNYEQLTENLGQRLSSRIVHLSACCELFSTNVRGMDLDEID